MSRFYGMISQSARKTVPTARGHKKTGLTTDAAGWGGKITTRLYYCGETDRDMFEVWMHPHQGAGDSLMLCAGEVGNKLTVEFDPLAELRGLSNKESNCECGIDRDGNWSDEVFNRFGCEC